MGHRIAQLTSTRSGNQQLTNPDFWSFPSAAGAQKQNALDKAQKELKDASSKIEETKKQLAVAQKGREDTVCLTSFFLPS